MLSKLLIILTCFSALLFTPQVSVSTTWHVLPDGTGDAATIQAAIDSAAAGDSVMLAAGTFTGPGNYNVDFLGKAIAVTSESGASLTTVDCSGLGGAFIFQNGETTASILADITITNSSTTAVTVTGASPTIQANVFVDCTGIGGGAISISGTEAPNITNNTFTNCSAWYGGAIAVLPGSLAEIQGNTITSCHATLQGGGVFCGTNTNALLNDNRFETNDAAGGGVNGAGGGLYGGKGSTLEITNNVFDGNVAVEGAFGGGVGLYFCNGLVLSNQFSNNTVSEPDAGDGGGGGLFSWASGDIIVEDNDFENNSAKISGGMYLTVDTTYTLDTLFVRSNRFNGNDARSGGGLTMQGHHLRPSIVEDCTFTSNTAQEVGGASFPGYVTVRRCVFTQNTATQGGGGVGIGYKSSMYECEITNNSAQIGGGISFGYGTITHCLIRGNHAEIGGGVNMDRGTLQHCTIVENNADFGGGISIEGEFSIAVIENSIIAFNTGGGAFYCVSDSISWEQTVACNDFFGNVGGDSICGTAGIGNISEDPLFCDGPNGDYTISSGSPCAPANNTCGVLMGAFPVNCGPVPVMFSAVQATALEDVVEIRWNMHADEAVTGFNIYRRQGSQESETRVNESGLINPNARSYSDVNIRPSTVYVYRLVAVTPDGAELSSPTTTVTIPAGRLTLEQNHPNPFNPTTSIRFTLPAELHVELGVYDARGKRVQTLVSGVRTAGPHDAAWNGRDHTGNPVGSGVYFVRLRAGNQTFTRKMLLLK